MAGKKCPQVLVPYYEHRRVPADAIVHAAACRCRRIRGLASRDRQHSGKHKNLAKKFAVRIAVSLADVAGWIDWLLHACKPLLRAEAGLGNGVKKHQSRASGVFKRIVCPILDAEMRRYVGEPVPGP